MLLWWLSGKESACQCRRHELNPWVREIPWRRKWQPIPVFLPEKSHGQRRLVGYSPWGHKESDKTEQLSISPLCCKLIITVSSLYRRKGKTLRKLASLLVYKF